MCAAPQIKVEKKSKGLPSLPVSVVAHAMVVVWERKLDAPSPSAENEVGGHDDVVRLGTPAASL